MLDPDAAARDSLRWLGADPPETARAPDLIAIGDDDQLLPIGRPRRREIVVVNAVIVARKLAITIGRDSLLLAAMSIVYLHREDVPPTLERCAHEGDSRAIG